MTTKTSSNPWTMDVRVRERNLKSGSLTEKDLEKHLGALPDLEGQYESFSTPQPALEQPRVVAAPSSVAESESDLDDEDEAEDESSGDVGGATAEDGGAAPADAGGGDVPTEGGGEA